MGLVILVVGGIVGGSLLWVLLQNRMARAKTEAARRWPATTGRVTQSVLHQRYNQSIKTPRTYYFPVIHYAYTVAGQAYEGTRISFGSVETTYADKAEEMRQRFPEGATVEVRYDPQTPGESILAAMIG